MSPLFVIVLIVLIDLMGLTIVMPLLPRFADQYGFSRGQIGLLLAIYPLCQLVAAPILGRLSDRYGRRPVLAVSQFGTALSFLILGLSRDYRVMLLARALDGASGGNFLVAQAYIADVTKPEDRSKGFGLFGAAFGLGFVLGPLLAAVLLDLPISERWHLRVPFLAAAAFSTLAWILVLTRLPESTDAAHRERARVLTWRGLVDTFQMPSVGFLVLIGSLITLAFAALEGTFSLYLKDRFGATPRQSTYGFVLLGLVAVIVQGGFIRRLVPRFGESRLVVFGLSAMTLGLAGLAITGSVSGLIASAVLLGAGYGVAGPSGVGLLSRATPATEQGVVFGVLASAQMLGRMSQYLLANFLGANSPSMPYWEGAAIALLGVVVAVIAIQRVIGWNPQRHGQGASEAVPITAADAD